MFNHLVQNGMCQKTYHLYKNPVPIKICTNLHLVHNIYIRLGNTMEEKVNTEISLYSYINLPMVEFKSLSSSDKKKLAPKKPQELSTT